MAIIINMGDYWVESHETTITLTNGAGTHQSAIVNLDKPGRFIGATSTLANQASNDNTQGMGGSPEIRDQASVQIVYGTAITGFRLRQNKIAGTAGNTVVSFFVLIFLRR